VIFLCFVDLPLSISLDNAQLDENLLYFTIFPLQPSTCFEHYMLIIRRLKCIDVTSGIVLSVSGHPVHRTATDLEDDTICCIIKFSLLMMSM